MKVFLVIIGIILVSFIAFVGLVSLKLFIIGKVEEVPSIKVEDLTITENRVYFSSWFFSSATVMGGYSYKVKDDTMYIRIRSVIVGVVRKPYIVDIHGDFSSLTKVVLEDRNIKRTIWTKEAGGVSGYDSIDYP